LPHAGAQSYDGPAAAKDRVVGFLRTAAPLQQWLDQRVGPDPA
jgi:hypothetical protein